MKLLSKEHAVVVKAASTDETRYILQGVYLEETKEGLNAVATDGRILAMVEDKSGAMAADEFPANVIPKDAENDATHAIVPIDAFQSAVKALPKQGRISLPILQHVAVVMGKKTTTLGVTDLQCPTVKSVANIEGIFPNYRQSIPTAKADLVTAYSPALLMRACQMAVAFGLDSMKLEFTSALDPVKISGSHNGKDLTIVVVPMRV